MRAWAAHRTATAPIAPAEARALAVRILQDDSFVVLASNDQGDSVYLAPPGIPFVLRVSNHARRPRQRRNHGEVLVSLVIDRPVSRVQLESRIAAAQRDFTARCNHRMSDTPTCSDEGAERRSAVLVLPG